MAFTTLVSGQLLHAPLARTGRRPATLSGPGANRWLWGALGLSAALQVAALAFPPLRVALGSTALRTADLVLSLGAALAAVGTIEGERLLRQALTPAAQPLEATPQMMATGG